MVNRFFSCLKKSTALKRLAPVIPLLFGATQTVAHPHSWVDMKTHIEGRNGLISGFNMEWTFDAMTSAFMLEGENSSSPEKLQKALDELSVSVMENIKKEDYFTHFYNGSQSIDFKSARNGTFRRERARLVLTFNLPLVKPQPLAADSLKLQIFEPSFYVDMHWPVKQNITLSDDLAKQCDLELILPNPTPQQMSYALSLPQDAEPDDSLGILFTQSIRLHCAIPADKKGTEATQ